MSAKHTPGPWVMESEGSEGFAINAAGVAKWKHVAVARANHEGREAVGEEEAEANANLIAAAPELLATIHKCLNLVVSKPGSGLSEYDRCQLASWLREAIGD